MPLVWTQVKTGLDPKRFTDRTVPVLIRKSKAWTDYCESERPLDAIKRLGTTPPHRTIKMEPYLRLPSFDRILAGHQTEGFG